jgi:hypothetical protein
MATKHNHVTRQIKSRGLCPACDEYRRRNPSVSTSSSFVQSSHDDAFMDSFLSTFIASEIASSFDSGSYDFGSSSSSSFDSGSFGGDGGSF